jgi:hypothetical protein
VFLGCSFERHDQCCPPGRFRVIARALKPDLVHCPRYFLSIRQQTTGTVSTTHFIHDIFGNVIAETSGTAAGTVREYI